MKCDYKRTEGKISAAERALIKGCAENGVGIENLGNGSTFRFIPAATKQPNPHCAPSNRGSFTPPLDGRPRYRTWSPASLSLNPQYKTPMRDDPPELTKARKAWAEGDATKLAAYLEAAKHDW